MKNYKNIALGLVSSVLLFSCNKDFKDEISVEENGNTYPTTVAFASATVNVPEEGGATDVSVSLIGPGQSSDLTVNVSIVETGVSAGTNYTISSSSEIVIPAGEYVGSVSVTPIDNFTTAEGNQTITMTITGTSDASVSIGSEVAAGRVVAVNIVDNDCPYDVADWVGTYTVTEAFTGPPNAPLGFSDFFGQSYQIEMAADPSDATGYSVLLTNSAGFNQFLVDGTVLTFVPCSGTVSFPGGDPNVANFTILTVVSNSYKDFEVRVDGDSNGFGDYGFTLEKQ